MRIVHSENGAASSLKDNTTTVPWGYHNDGCMLHARHKLIKPNLTLALTKKGSLWMNRNHRDKSRSQPCIDDGNLARTISIISMKNWHAGKPTPQSRNHLLGLIKHVQALATGQISSDHPVVVTCHDGATASGLFLSLITALEMVRFENKVDLCRIVRSIRRSRKEFMRKTEQFGFLYDVIMDYFYDHQPHVQQVIYSNECDEVLYSNVKNNCQVD